METDAIFKPDEQGVLFRQRQAHAAVEGAVWAERTLPPEARRFRSGLDHLAFAGLASFTLLLYVRPNDLLPGLFGTFPFAKISILVSLLAYLSLRLIERRPLSLWPLEAKMLSLIGLVGAVLIPVSTWPQQAAGTLLDQFLKVFCIFILLINLLDSRWRLRVLILLMVLCVTLLAAGAIQRYLAGELDLKGERIRGHVGVFEDPNDMATVFNMLLPLAVVLALLTRGWRRWALAGCAGVLVIGVIVTFSRGGFLGLAVSGGLLLWYLRHAHRKLTKLVPAAALTVLILALPTEYGRRLYTIVKPEQDVTTSAEVRKEVLQRAIVVAARHAVIGVGMGCFPLHSIRDMRAHNAYVEITADLGLPGLIPYLILMLAPLVLLRRLQTEVAGRRDPNLDLTPAEREVYYLGVALQAAIVAYLICSFFLSIQYSWYVYYPVAFAVALRQIHRADRLNQLTGGVEVAGAIWRPHQL